ncbi:DNA ligase [Vibrio albus]|uniref:DNA ligase n=1 Tax=Vibrio albus TaxID=2200953 RepID=A0A2U3BD66_9VIBR|nr:DNA ligase [Vibrio albus]PWI34720.1 DNA ligase [Vibrio albus]
MQISTSSRNKAILLLTGVTSVSLSDYAVAFSEPNIVLANRFTESLELKHYLMSEKLDGIRAFWTGKDLLTRKGNKIYAPHWFIQSLPDFPVEGELWAGRGNFHMVQSTVLDKVPKDTAWEHIRLMLFDLPEEKGPYSERYRRLVQLVTSVESPHLGYIEHSLVASELALLDFLDSLQVLGGEGVMLRRTDSEYRAGRSDDLVKLKKHQDAEAEVIGYKPGSGKYTGLMGAIHVKLENGRTFYIGSGFTDEDRRTPPPLGSVITFKFNGYTVSGLPRFARFQRIRKD